jgi:hypothetical protein
MSTRPLKILCKGPLKTKELLSIEETMNDKKFDKFLAVRHIIPAEPPAEPA